MKIQLSGTIYEIGDLENSDNRGVRMDRENGETLQITGLTIEECKTLATQFAKAINIEIT